MSLKKIIVNGKTKIVDAVTKFVTMSSGLSQEDTARLGEEKTVTEGMPALLRKIAAQGAVLLKNESILPLEKGAAVSLFGRNQLEWFYTGYGSGGDVNNPYAVSPVEGIKNCDGLKINEELLKIYEDYNEKNPMDHGFWGHWPRCCPEMPLDRETVENAAKASDCAVVCIGRSSGEDRENTLEKGSFYLNDEERKMLSLVTECFEKTVVLLNIGCIMDLSFIEEYGEKIGAAMIVWQGGMESGNAVADLLSGAVNPSGRLTDTVARHYEDYPGAENFGGRNYNIYKEDIYVGYRWFETFKPETVLYPFGYGLSYTDFSVNCNGVSENESGYTFTVAVKNTGERFSGKEVVQLYIEKPCGVMGNPSRVLAAFAKTDELSPNGEQTLTLFVSKAQLASYDDSGVTGNRSAYVTEKGIYGFYLGKNVRDAELVHSVEIEDTEVLESLEQTAAPKQAFSVYKAVEKDGKRLLAEETVAVARYDLKKIILDNLPKEITYTGDMGLTLAQVKSGEVSLDDFVAQLDLEELEAISRGDYTMNSPLGVAGNAGTIGGVLPSLREKGVAAVTTTDGPSGIRLQACCSLIPIGTLLACTFDTALVEELYEAVGKEMLEKGSDVLLAPGMNIHRNPLCGRNFEYYSEDPLLTGKIAAAAVKGLQKTGVSACPKHFACNNQEFRRNKNDSRLSERALREIYLKGFEICVKEAKPKSIMTSYNMVNGVYSHYNYELCRRILRGEWGFEGCIMTDWWMQYIKSPEFPNLRDNAYRVRGCVDVLMPGGKRVGKKKSDGTLLKTYSSPNGITLGEMQYCAKNVLKFVMDSPAMDREIKI